MDNRSLPLWRSLLFCPANSERFLSRAHERGADAIILDLEDSIAQFEKQEARLNLRTHVSHIRENGVDVLVRINRELDLAVVDIAAAVCPSLAGIVMPKVKGPEHVQLLAELITAHELEMHMEVGQTRIIALVETAEGICKINEIAKSHPRLVGMAVGGEDLATELDAEPSADSLYVAKMLGVHAARAAGILPIGVLASVANISSDEQEYKAMLSRSRRLGFTGATCVHPRQVPLLNQAFSPGAAQVDMARRIIEAYEAAEKRGEGAIAFEGKMVDKPVVARARRLLSQLDAQKSIT